MSDAPPELPNRNHTRRQLAWLVGRVLLGVAALCALVLWFASPKADGVRMVAGTPNLDARKVAFSLDSHPPGATVSVAGQKRGTTPLSVELFIGDVPVPIRFELDGYATQVRDVTPSAPGKLDVTLSKQK